MINSSQHTRSAVDFHSLGTRKHWHYSDEEKAQLFRSSLGALETLTEAKSSHNAPASIPELVRRLFDDTDGDKNLETIREMMRPTTRLTLCDLSASGQKFLALLAILQDGSCLDSDGRIRLEYTKSVIRGWFHQSDEIHFDDSALQNIHTTRGGSDLHLGQNRLSEIKIQLTGDLSRKLKANVDKAEFGESSIKLNFDQIPQCSLKTDFHEIAFGDMNGNSIMFLHQLVHAGLADIKPDKGQDWQQLMNAIRDGKIDRFRALLPQVLSLQNTDKKLVLLGDLLSDRTFNDWYTLSILDFLHTAGQNFSICFSNHDAAFVEYFLANHNKPISEDYVATDVDQLKHSVSPNNSLQSLNATLNTRKDMRAEFERMARNYFSHLVMVDASLDQRDIYAHGVITDQILTDMVQRAGIDAEAISDIGLQERIQIVNRYFREHAFTNLESFQALMSTPEDPELSDQNPFHAAIWSIGPFANNKAMLGNREHPYLDPRTPMDCLRVVHGHTEDIRLKAERKSTLHDFLNESGKALTTLSKMPDQGGRWTFVRNALQAGASPDLITFCIGLMIHESRNIKRTGDTAINAALENLLQAANQYPRSEVIFFNAYLELNQHDELTLAIEKFNKKSSVPKAQRYGKFVRDPSNKKTFLLTFQEAQIEAQKKIFAAMESLNKQFDLPVSYFDRIADDDAQSDLLHCIGNKLATNLKSVDGMDQTVGEALFQERLTQELQSIWQTEHDDSARKSYISLDSGSGANETDRTAEVRIFTA